MSRPAPQSPREVTAYIGTILRQKRALLDTLKDAELEAREKRREADKAEARAFLTAQGSIPVKKYATDLDPAVDKMRGEADVAEVIVNDLKRRIHHCTDEIDGARTAAATLRAEFSVLGLSDEGS